jgi:hypothetical protein
MYVCTYVAEYNTASLLSTLDIPLLLQQHTGCKYCVTKPSLKRALFNSSACRFFSIGIKLNVSSVTDSNDQKGMKTQFLSGPQTALGNHSGTSKRPDGEFMKFDASY